MTISDGYSFGRIFLNFSAIRFVFDLLLLSQIYFYSGSLPFRFHFFKFLFNFPHIIDEYLERDGRVLNFAFTHFVSAPFIVVLASQSYPFISL